jgi:signal transduction histidine kinase
MNTNGVGLGLFITKSIINQFDGKVLLRSRTNKGSQFIFKFMLNKKDQFNLGDNESQFDLSRSNFSIQPNIFKTNNFS